MRNRTKFINFFVTTIDLSFQIPANATSGSFDVVSKSADGYSLADGDYEFWFVADYSQISNREIFRAYRVSGKTIYWDRRVSPNGQKLHDGGASIQINDIAEILNWFSTNVDDFGLVDSVPSALSVAVKGGPISKDVTIPTTTLAIPASSSGYVVYDFGARSFAFVTTLTEPNNYFTLAQVASGLAAITSVTDLRAPFFGYKTSGAGTMYLCDDGSYKPLTGPLVSGLAFQADEVSIGTFAAFDTVSGGGLALVADPANGRVKLSADPAKLNSKLYAVTTGSAGAYVATLSPAPASLFAGLKATIKVNVASAGADTLNLNGFGAAKLKKYGGVQDLLPNDLKAGEVVDLWYDGTVWQIPSFPPSYSRSQHGGSGEDGDVLGALTITGQDDSIVVKHYRNFKPGAATINTTTRRSLIYCKVAGDLDLTGTTIDMAGRGCLGGAAGATGASGIAGEKMSDWLISTAAAGGGFGSSANNAGQTTGSSGAGGASLLLDGNDGIFATGASAPNPPLKGLCPTLLKSNFIGLKFLNGMPLFFVPQGGGGGGGGGSSNGPGGAGGKGGDGGGMIIFEVAGNVILTGAIINCNGTNGSTGTPGTQGGNGIAGSGNGSNGGGGAGGLFMLLYAGTLTGSATPNVNGGTGNAVVAQVTGGAFPGNNPSDGRVGGAGALGYSLIAKVK